jgi:hypothetical protein
MSSVGVPEQPVEVTISGNTIRDSSQRGINLKQIRGRVSIEHNLVSMGVMHTGPAQAQISGIHCAGSGSYRIADNRIDVSDPGAAGIRLTAMRAIGAAIERATITDNDVTMSVAEGFVPGPHSVGIEVMGPDRESLVQGNRIRGRARDALSVESEKSGRHTRNTIDRNNLEGFVSAPSQGGNLE